MQHFKIVVEPPAITTIYHDVQAKFKVDSRLLDGMIIHMSQKRKVEKSTVHETVAGVTHERKLAFGRLVSQGKVYGAHCRKERDSGRRYSS